jgi:hypothetical protein
MQADSISARGRQRARPYAFLLTYAARKAQSIKIADFITVFRGAGIRSWFDWDRLEPGSYSVIEEYSRTKSVLGRLETVWYVWPDGSLGDWRNQDNRRVCVEEAASLTRFPNDKGLAYINELAVRIDNATAPEILVLPCYRTRTGKSLLLDGNHRAIAAFRSKRDVRLMIFAVTGADNPLLLPDLIHETKGGVPVDRWDTLREEIERNFTEG